MPAYKLTIPTPCHKKWGEMSPTEKGAFCQSCRKDVVDFTGMSSFEIADVLRKNSSTCGKLTTTQLDFVYEVMPNSYAKPTWFKRGMVGLVLSFLISALTVKAGTKLDKPAVENSNKLQFDKLPFTTEEPVDTNVIVIKGVVLSEENEPLSFATISLVNAATNDKVSIVADADGKFIMEFKADKITGDVIVLLAKVVGYPEKELFIRKNKAFEYQTIVMEKNSIQLLGVIIKVDVEPPLPVTPVESKVWWGIKYGIWD
ncbi:MAG: carboxypeptidase-like regulatory domain-containing protein [Sphingobacteriales bacterium JAD_PAG50586_3]|nr:MAG: carboxypeptidase-like regulatory domain-containing protein [Sphingobacteriales bacterium JAD_PAG50586_3]